MTDRLSIALAQLNPGETALIAIVAYISGAIPLETNSATVDPLNQIQVVDASQNTVSHRWTKIFIQVGGSVGP